MLQRPAAEYVLKYVKRGSRILVNGRLESRNLLRADGSQEKRIAVVVGEFEFTDIIIRRLHLATVTRVPSWRTAHSILAMSEEVVVLVLAV